MRYMIISLLALASLMASAQFDKYFENKSLRFDYYHAGDSQSDTYYYDETKMEPYWGGSKVNLIDTFNYGNNYVKVFDLASNDLIYSRGYCTLFGEWQTVPEAKETKKSLSETVIIPYPKNDARIELYTRKRDGQFERKFEYLFKPSSYFISQERKLSYPVFDAYISGDPAEKVDIVIIPDGYTEAEMGKFISDCQKFASEMFDFAPYDRNKDKFNIRGVMAPSAESGNDIPADSIWKNTVVGTSYYTFDSERYCMTYDHKSVRDVAANAPYDQIYILVNRNKYGGGAIYNFYNVTASGNLASAKIFIHELGHGFAGLGDEYVGAVSYSDFYPTTVEPWEPNLTTLVNFDRKWKNLVDKRTPIPTPDEEKYYTVTGVFEGGGYVSKGIYRPKHDCLMNTFKEEKFCPVCEAAIQKMIDFYTK
jgi:hypothetical protein